VIILDIITLVIATMALLLAYLAYSRTEKFIDSMLMEKPTAKGGVGRDPYNAERLVPSTSTTNQFIPTTFRGAPNLSPQAIAPAVVCPPIPKGGFGARIHGPQE
jgi:hypothetical protein